MSVITSDRRFVLDEERGKDVKLLMLVACMTSFLNTSSYSVIKSGTEVARFISYRCRTRVGVGWGVLFRPSGHVSKGLSPAAPGLL